MNERILFVDRDGTILEEPEDFQVDRFEKMRFVEGVLPALELFAEELRLAQQALGEITGEFTADDLLGVIFSRFCIGK